MLGSASLHYFSKLLSAPEWGVIFFEGLSIFSRILIGFAIILFIFGMGLIFFKSPQKVQIASSSFKCSSGECKYSYQLKNNSSNSHSGIVYVLLRYGKVRSGYAQDVGYIEREFNLSGNSEKTFSGIYKSDKKLDAYFRLNSKKYNKQLKRDF